MPCERRSIVSKPLQAPAPSAGEPGAGLAETWNTLDYLAEAGIRYVCDWVNDDQPYRFEIGTPPLVSLPYSVQTNDVPAYFEMKASVPEFEAMLKRQFDTLYREGKTVPRVMAIAVHPFVTGQPHRIGALDAALSRLHLLASGRLARHRLGDRAALPVATTVRPPRLQTEQPL